MGICSTKNERVGVCIEEVSCSTTLCANVQHCCSYLPEVTNCITSLHLHFNETSPTVGRKLVMQVNKQTSSLTAKPLQHPSLAVHGERLRREQNHRTVYLHNCMFRPIQCTLTTSDDSQYLTK